MDRLVTQEIPQLRYPYYNFYADRPHSSAKEDGGRTIEWPTNELFYWRNQNSTHDLVIFLGVEPHLLWRTYISLIMGVAQQTGVCRVVMLGGTYDAVPHDVPPIVTCSTSDEPLRQMLEGMGVRSTTYEGPASIHSPVIAACEERGIPCVSVWGHAPNYVRASPNAKVCHAILKKLQPLLEINIDQDDIWADAARQDRRVERALARDPDLRAYVEKLQEQFKQAPPPPSEPLNSETVIQDLEEFLRQQRKEGGEPRPGA
ncbi:MAG: hypothetical protein HW403_665 [Dehalococcoidia bacterium]|nr:hypothetical protein [Dehalococcoidia bacterium]